MNERRRLAWGEFFDGPFKAAVESVYDEDAGWTPELLKGLSQIAASSFRAGWEERGPENHNQQRIVEMLGQIRMYAENHMYANPKGLDASTNVVNCFEKIYDLAGEIQILLAKPSDESRNTSDGKETADERRCGDCGGHCGAGTGPRRTASFCSVQRGRPYTPAHWRACTRRVT